MLVTNGSTRDGGAHPPHTKYDRARYIGPHCREHLSEWWPWAAEFRSPERTSEGHLGARFGDVGDAGGGVPRFEITADGEPVDVNRVVEVIAGRPGAVLLIDRAGRCEVCGIPTVEMWTRLEVTVRRVS